MRIFLGKFRIQIAQYNSTELEILLFVMATLSLPILVNATILRRLKRCLKALDQLKYMLQLYSALTVVLRFYLSQLAKSQW